MPRHGTDLCSQCRRSLPADEFVTLGRYHQPCRDCRDNNRRRQQPRRDPEPRLLQELRQADPAGMTEREKTLVSAARVAASRRWPVTADDQEARWQRDQRLHAALFAAGCVLLAGSYPEAARIQGQISIEFVPGGADRLTTVLIDLATSPAHGETAHILITDAHLPAGAIDAFERRAGRAIGVYPQKGR